MELSSDSECNHRLGAFAHFSWRTSRSGASYKQHTRQDLEPTLSGHSVVDQQARTGWRKAQGLQEPESHHAMGPPNYPPALSDKASLRESCGRQPARPRHCVAAAIARVGGPGCVLACTSRRLTYTAFFNFISPALSLLPG